MDWTKLAGAGLVAIVLLGSWVVSPSSEAQVNNDPAAANTLTIEITGIKEPKGKMACALFWQNKGFPRKHRRALRRTWVDVKGDTVKCVFKRTGLGEYAASVFLDKIAMGSSTPMRSVAPRSHGACHRMPPTSGSGRPSTMMRSLTTKADP